MARPISAAQRKAELDAVKAAMADRAWHQPGDVAARANLTIAVVLSVLRELSAERREFLIPRLHVGADRTRKTSRLIVEYRLVSASLDLSVFPSFLLCPSKEKTWQRSP